MRVVVVGAGPAGSVAALLLSRQGHHVTVVDRNTGPSRDGSWERKGVFQFHLAHAYRAPTVTHLERSLPDVYEALLAAGAGEMRAPGAAGVVGLYCRRETFDAVLWAAVSNEPALSLRCGHVDSIEVTGSTVTGVRMNGVHLPADLVVDASGRGVVSASRRGGPEGGPCGFAYVSRTYRLHPGAGPGPINAPPGHTTFRDGYSQIVFRHDNGYFNVVIIRATADKELAELRHEPLWNRAIRLLPGASAWTRPDRASPAGPVRAGSGLTNSYLGQALDVTGLLAIGDAVATTNPAGGRGVSLGISSAAHLVRVVAEWPRSEWARELDAWCADQLRPWVRDQIEADAAMLRRWAGEPIDPQAPIPVDLLTAALLTQPEHRPAVMPYLQLQATSRSLAPLRDRARQILAEGWRPVEDEGPSRSDLSRLVSV